MDTHENIQKKLDLIKKKGDLHDMISKKRNVLPEDTATKIKKVQILFFSRILYLFLISSINLKNRFAPLKKIKEAQEEIRKYIGVDIDIFRSKNKKKKLAILYEESFHEDDLLTYLGKNVLLKNLEKILNFCNEFGIDKIYLQQSYISNYVSIDLQNQLKTTCNVDLLDIDHWHIDISLFDLEKKQLSEIIEEVKNNNYDLESIFNFFDKIQDNIVKKAIEEFKISKNIEKLFSIVKSRFVLYLNSEGVSKDRNYGKTYEEIEISDIYVKVSLHDTKGILLEQKVMSLYDYFEVKDYESLEKSIHGNSDDEEIKNLSLLYLYLLEMQKEMEEKQFSYKSFYDSIYENYQKRKFKKKIPWINSRLMKIKKEILSICIALLTFLVPSTAIDYALDTSSHEKNVFQKVCSYIVDLYEKSINFERNIIKTIRQAIEKIQPDKSEENIASYSQSQMYAPSNGMDVAEIEWFSTEKRPLYFINKFKEYGLSFHYATVDLRDVKDIRPMFQIKMPLSEEVIEDVKFYNRLLLPLDIYPVGDNYALTKIYIIDDSDPKKTFNIDSEWVLNNSRYLNEEEKELLCSMQSPIICYIYGLDQKDKTSLFEPKKQNISNEPNDVKKAILEGLHLDENATMEEINKAITDKEYTSHPLALSGNNVEYYKNAASLEKIDIELAMMLVGEANRNLIYTVGYKNTDEDNKISVDEAYVWMMTEEGEIIDILEDFIGKREKNDSIELESNGSWLDYQVNNQNSTFISAKEREKTNVSLTLSQEEEQKNDTKKINELEDFIGKRENNDSIEREKTNDSLTLPQEEEQKNDTKKINEIVKEIFSWIIKNKIPYYIGAMLAYTIIYKLFGKKIQLKLKLNNAHRVLADQNIEETYAQLMNFIYGGTNIPINRTENEMIEVIYKEFFALQKEEIQEILKEIKSCKEEDQQYLKRIHKLLSEIPFIIEQKEKLQESSEKKLVLRR